MRTFQDTLGRTWSLAITVADLKRLRQELQLDLMRILEEECRLLKQLADDPILLVETLWILCEPAATKQGVTPEDFGAAMGGDTLDAASDALMDAIVDFFPRGQRPALAKALAKIREVIERQSQVIVERLDSPEVAQLIDSALRKSGEQFMRSLEERASILTPSVSASSPGSPKDEPKRSGTTRRR